MSIIETDALTRRYGSRRGIETVTLCVPEGSLFGFLGPNGAGKTTAIRVMLGLLKPSGGAARIFGLDCWHDGRVIRRDVGYVPGDLRLHDWMTGRQALRLFSKIRRQDLFISGTRLADQFDLNLRVRVRNMSRGMRQKLGLILALAHRPRLLILDEPTVTLDPLMQELVHRHLRELAAGGHTIFFSSHTLSEVEELCDRVAIIRTGRLVADESLEKLREHAGHQVTIRFRDPKAATRFAKPTGFEGTSEGADWNGLYHGPIDELVDWLAGKPIADLAVARPDLETLFRRYYAEGS